MLKKIGILFALILISVFTLASCGDSSYGPDGMKFTLKDDGTYSVSIGRLKNQSKIVIPSTYNDKAVTEIAEDGFAFYLHDPDYTIEEVVIPDTVTHIGDNAFSCCAALTSITIPNSVISIGEYAFSSCDSLAFNEHENAYYIGNESNPYLVLIRATTKNIASCEIHKDARFIQSGAFLQCGNLKSITIHDGIFSIGSSSFRDCSSLTDVDIGENVKRIGGYAFYGCYKITSLLIPDATESIGTEAFKYCSGISMISIGKGLKSVGKDAFSKCDKLLAVSIYDLTAWCNIAFENCDANPLSNKCDLYDHTSIITILSIPSDVKTISDYAFYNCKSLVCVKIIHNINAIGTDAFWGCSDLRRVEIGSLDNWASVTFSNYYANPLYHAENLYYFGESITNAEIVHAEKISDYAFYNCKNIKSVKISDSVKSIGYGAFDCCSYLEEVSIGNGVTSIGIGAFHNCRRMTRIVVGSGLETVGESAFLYCDSLANVYFRGSAKQWKNIEFGDDNDRFVYCNDKRYSYTGE